MGITHTKAWTLGRGWKDSAHSEIRLVRSKGSGDSDTEAGQKVKRGVQVCDLCLGCTAEQMRRGMQVSRSPVLGVGMSVPLTSPTRGSPVGRKSPNLRNFGFKVLVGHVGWFVGDVQL